MAAAKLMRDQQVGCLVVVSKNKPIGILTDRDLVREVLAARRDENITRVDEVMNRNLYTVTQDTGIFEAVSILCEKGIRRLPVIDQKGNLVGIIAADDLFFLLGTEFVNLAGISAAERNRERESVTVG